jgi:hypothetical protein
MADYFSSRFNKNIWINDHARKSMLKRNVDDVALIEIIENGEIKYHNDDHIWVFKHIENRTDNLICAAIVNKDALIVKTVMIKWELEVKP